MIELLEMKTGYLRFNNRARGMKTYRAIYDGIGGFAKVSRKNHKTAKQAFEYGVKVVNRLRRMQEVAKLEKVQS